MKIEPFRFKTEEEFIKEYGRYTWRSRINWIPEMDPLFGKSLRDNTRFSINQSMYKEYTDEEYNTMQKQTAKELAGISLSGSNFKVSGSNNGNVSITYVSPYNKRTCGFHIHSSPTGNCQLSSIVYFNTILLQHPLDEVRMIIRFLPKITTVAKMLFFDINEQYFSLIEDKISFVFIQKYTSTNGSKMICGMFKIASV